MHPPRLLLSLLVLTVVSPLAAQPRFTRAPALTPNPNPRVPLAAVLTFATDGPVVTQVRIADERGRNWDLAFDASHRPEQGLALVGFRSGQRHEVRVTVRDRQGRATEGPAPLAFSAPPLPAAAGAFPPLTVTRDPLAKLEPGFTALSVRRQGPGRPNDPFSTGWGMIVAIDAAGDPVWYYESDSRISDFERGPNGHLFLCTLDFEILEIDLLGNEVARWYAAGRPKGAGRGIAVPTMTFHHEIDVLPNGNLVVLGTDRRALPDWWASAWEQALGVAAPLAESVAHVTGRTHTAAEWKFDDTAIPIDSGALHIRGRIDLLLTTGASFEDAWLIDFKTGNRKGLSLGNLATGDGVQLALYALALRAAGAQSVGLSLLTPGAELATPQLTLADLDTLAPLWRGLWQMQESGVFGMRGALREEYGFRRDYPLATLAIDEEILAEKWTLTHPDFATAEDEP